MNRIALDAHYRTGGKSNQDVAFYLCVLGDGAELTRMPRLHDFLAGGPLDAPEQLPAGSCNSTDVRTGPWHLNNGAGQCVPAATHCAREA